MANSNVTKGERLLAALAQHPQCELTPEGACMVKQRFDPYHDTPFKPVGYPDAYNGHSVARCIKKSVTFSQTSGGAAAQATPWDAHVYMTPLLKQQSFMGMTSQVNNLFTYDYNAAQSGSLYGGLMITQNMVSGTDFNYPGTSLGSLSLSDADLSGNMRVTSLGFEIIDGTAELYRQGILTAYRQNQPQKDPQGYSGVATVNLPLNSMADYSFTAQEVRFPPNNTANAMLMPDTKQWKVSEGAYVSCDYNSTDIPMEIPGYTQPVMIGDFYQTPITADTSIGMIPRPTQAKIQTVPNTTTTTSRFVQGTTGQRILPISQSGCFLVGLNPQATITVNAIWYVECAPTSDDQELLSLCSQSPQQDVFAQMLMSKLRMDSPICVKLRENYTGQWFFEGVRDIVQKVAPWLQNVSTVGDQVVKWVDSAGRNDGLISPQSFVRGDVAPHVAKQKKIPPPPGPAPSRHAYRPKKVVVSHKSNPSNRRRLNNHAEIRRNAAKNKSNLKNPNPAPVLNNKVLSQRRRR